MELQTAALENRIDPGRRDFSVVLGGPLYRFWRRSHLSGSTLELLRRRIVVVALFAWLPLLLLCALDGHLLGGGLAVPFLLDIEAHIRFLVALPLLIFAEVTFYQRMRLVDIEFLKRRLIPASDVPRFDAAVASAIRLQSSTLAEVVLIVLVYGFGILFIWRQYIALDAATWYATSMNDGSTLSLAGMWYGFVSLPLFQFLLCRWYFRVFVWARFLWQVSRIPLALVPTHPDRTGGLGFLSSTVYAFFPLATAHGALLAGQLANRIFYAAGALTDYKAQIGALVVVLLCLGIGPLLVFSVQLWQSQLTGRREYGDLAERYVRDFDTKWLRNSQGHEPLLGSADIQSLADLGNSLAVVHSMRLAPVSRQAVFQLAGATVAPLLPLLLTMMPLSEVLKTLLRMLI